MDVRKESIDLAVAEEGGEVRHHGQIGGDMSALVAGGAQARVAGLGHTQLGRTQCCAFSADEGADVGSDEGTPVTEAYKVPFKFTGKITQVTIDTKDMKTSATDEAVKADAALKKRLSD
jgi:hypothetical protein